MASPTNLPPVHRAPVVQRSWFGPILLIATGVLFLLVSMGKVTPKAVFIGFAEYWPVILIVWGALKLVEYAQARSAGQPAPGIGAGGVALVVLLLVFGSAATAAYKATANMNWDNVRDHMQIDDEDLSGIFGGKKFESTEQLVKDFPAKASLQIKGSRGDVKLLPSTDGRLHLDYTRVIYANADVEADRLKGLVNPTVTSEGGVVTVDTSRNSDWKGARVNMTISVPAKTEAVVLLTRGAVDVNGFPGIKVTTQHGDVTLGNIGGNSEIHLEHGNVKAKGIKGDLWIEGRVDDAEINDVSGQVRCDGDFFGDLKLARVAKGVQFKSARTDLQLARLDGDFVMSGSDLRASSVLGPVKMVTKSKDVHIDDLVGDVHLEDKDGEVELHAKAPLGNIEVMNKRGEIRVMVPPGSGFQLEAHALHGEIDTDFGISANEVSRESVANGTVGKGGPRMQLSNENGSIRVKKN